MPPLFDAVFDRCPAHANDAQCFPGDLDALAFSETELDGTRRCGVRRRPACRHELVGRGCCRSRNGCRANRTVDIGSGRLWKHHRRFRHGGCVARYVDICPLKHSLIAPAADKAHGGATCVCGTSEQVSLSKSIWQRASRLEFQHGIAGTGRHNAAADRRYKRVFGFHRRTGSKSQCRYDEG